MLNSSIPEKHLENQSRHFKDNFNRLWAPVSTASHIYIYIFTKYLYIYLIMVSTESESFLFKLLI